MYQPPNRRASITSWWKGFWWQIFFAFHIHIFDAFWPNFMALSFQLLKLWPFLEGWYSQNDDFTIKTLYKWQILEIAVKCEQLKIYTWNFARILVFIRVLRLYENFWNLYCFHCLSTVLHFLQTIKQ